MIRRCWLAAILALAALHASAADYVLVDYDIDSTSMIFPVVCTPPFVATSVNRCPGDGWSNAKKITTSGASSTTITAVTATDDAFAAADVDSIISFVPTQSSSATIRRLTAKASADSVTADVATTIPTAGVNFRLWNLLIGTGAANDGWFRYPANGNLTIVFTIAQMNATSVDYVVQCRHTYGSDRYSGPVYVAGTAATPIAMTAVGAQRVTLTDEGFDSCRVGVKVTTDDGGDTGANAEKVTVTIESPAGH